MMARLKLSFFLSCLVLGLFVGVSSASAEPNYKCECIVYEKKSGQNACSLATTNQEVDYTDYGTDVKSAHGSEVITMGHKTCDISFALMAFNSKDFCYMPNIPAPGKSTSCRPVLCKGNDKTTCTDPIEYCKKFKGTACITDVSCDWNSSKTVCQPADVVEKEDAETIKKAKETAAADAAEEKLKACEFTSENECAASQYCAWYQEKCRKKDSLTPEEQQAILTANTEAFLSERYKKPDGYEGPLPDCAFTGTCKNVNQLLELFIKLGRSILSLVGLFGLGYFVYGGFLMITSFGNEERLKQGRAALMAAVLGIIIVFSAYLVADFVLDALQVGNDFRAIGTLD